MAELEINETVLRMLTAKLGLPAQFVFKDAKLFEALSKVLLANKNIGLDIVMKGGTALNKAYLSTVQRFSEDIDFDIFSDTKDLAKIVSIEGFTIEGPWKLRDTIRYHLIYDFLGRKDSLRVEFTTKKLRKTLNPITVQNMTSAVTGSVLFDVPIYSFDDLVARKMNALRERTEGKDIWDCYHAIPKTQHLKEAIKFALESEKSDMSTEDSLKKTISKLKRVDAKSVMKLTNPYIPTYLRPMDWIEMIDSLEYQLENLL